ncbi:MAG: hypothetical protein ABI600_00345 [Luteolibacter sp.]
MEAIAGTDAGMMAVFVTSGIMHELAITIPVRSNFALPTVYFTLHGTLALLERKWGRPFGKIPALLAVIVPMRQLFPTTFQNDPTKPHPPPHEKSHIHGRRRLIGCNGLASG